MSGETEKMVSGWTVDTLKELTDRDNRALREIAQERDLLYKERDESRRVAVEAALIAVKEQTKASFEGSEKAIEKAENAQIAYNHAHNDLLRKLDEQNKAAMPRTEIEARFQAMAEKIESLSKFSHEVKAIDLLRERTVDTRQASHGNIIGWASVIGGLVAIVVGALIHFISKG